MQHSLFTKQQCSEPLNMPRQHKPDPSAIKVARKEAKVEFIFKKHPYIVLGPTTSPHNVT